MPENWALFTFANMRWNNGFVRCFERIMYYAKWSFAHVCRVSFCFVWSPLSVFCEGNKRGHSWYKGGEGTFKVIYMKTNYNALIWNMYTNDKKSKLRLNKILKIDPFKNTQLWPIYSVPKSQLGNLCNIYINIHGITYARPFDTPIYPKLYVSLKSLNK